LRRGFFIPGDVLLLEREIASLPYETGIFVLCELTLATAEVELMSADDQGLYAIDNRWTMSREDFTAFTPIREGARLGQSLQAAKVGCSPKKAGYCGKSSQQVFAKSIVLF
jgi:hypothetical protein